MSSAPRPAAGAERRALPFRAAGVPLAGLLLVATLGEGGGHPTWLLAWHAVLVGLLLVAVWPAGKHAERAQMPRGVVVAMALFLVLFAAGALRAPYAYGALLVALELGACLAVAWLAVRGGTAAMRSWLTPLQIGAALHGLWVLAQWGIVGRARPASTFLNPNHAGAWLVAVSLFALGSLQGHATRRTIVLRVGLALPAAAGVISGGSRGAALALVVGAAWLGWSRRARLPRAGRLALVAAAVLIVAFVGWRQLSRSERYDPFRYHRMQIWRASAAMAADEPLWGTGPGQLATAAANYAFADGEGPLRFDRALAKTHSDLLRLPAELGLPAALAALAVLIATARRTARRRRRGGSPHVAEGAVAALLALGAQALVDNPSSWPAVYLLASALWGALLSAPRAGPAESPDGRVGRLLAGLLLLLFVVADVGPYLAWRLVSRLPAGPLDGVGVARLETAIALNPLHPAYHSRRAERILDDRGGWGPAAYADAREAVERAVRASPREARYRRDAALVEARACRTIFPDVACRSRVERRYLAAESRSRHDPFLPMGLAAFLLDAGDPAGARRAAARALALEPESVLPRLLLADALIESGEAGFLEQASRLIAEAREGAELWADWDGGAYGAGLLVPEPGVSRRLADKLARASAGVPRGAE